MTATRTASPHRAKALGYLRDGRVTVWSTGAPKPGAKAISVRATISRAPGDRTGLSVPVHVVLMEEVWDCDEHPGDNGCAHRLAVQMVTGHGRLEGRWAA